MNLDGSLYALLLAGHVTALGVMLVAIFVRRRWLRPIGVLAGAVAIWLPLFVLINTLGEPHPNPPNEVMKLLGAIQFEDDLYLFVDKKRGELTTRLYNVEIVENRYDPGQLNANQSGYDMLGVQVNPTDSGAYEVIYLDYEAPDWDKGGMQRGWR